MGDWIAFWDSEHSIYVNARHRDVHYRRIAQDIRAQLPPSAFGIDEADVVLVGMEIVEQLERQAAEAKAEELAAKIRS
jgi:predicted DNA-binding transcriptional regulator YafY